MKSQKPVPQTERTNQRILENAVHRDNLQSSVAFLYVNDELSKTEINKYCPYQAKPSVDSVQPRENYNSIFTVENRITENIVWYHKRPRRAKAVLTMVLVSKTDIQTREL
jgi:hypothetical protein